MEFNLFNFHICKKGWQIVIWEVKYFDHRKSWSILLLNKRKNQPLYLKSCLTQKKEKSPQP